MPDCSKAWPQRIHVHLCKFFTVYIWFSAMKKLFLKHLENITKKISIHLSSSRILDQSLCLKNDHFLPEKLDKPFFHKNLDFFVQFPSMTFENTLLIDDMPHKSLFNPPLSAIFLKTFYRLHSDANYLL